MKLKKLVKNISYGTFVKVYADSENTFVECTSEVLLNMIKNEEVTNFKVIIFEPYYESANDYGLKVFCTNK